MHFANIHVIAEHFADRIADFDLTQHGQPGILLSWQNQNYFFLSTTDHQLLELIVDVTKWGTNVRIGKIPSGTRQCHFACDPFIEGIELIVVCRAEHVPSGTITVRSGDAKQCHVPFFGLLLQNWLQALLLGMENRFAKELLLHGNFPP